MNEQRLRVVIADEVKEAVDATERTMRALGHDVVAKETDIAAAARAAEVTGADATVVSVHDSEEHALDLVERVSETAPCPVVLLVDEENPEFVRRAAERGLDAYANRERADSVRAALALARRNFDEMRALGGQLRDMEAGLARRATIEQAKGVLIERHDIDAASAFEMLRTSARRQRRRLVDVAQATLAARGGLPKAGPDELVSEDDIPPAGT